MGMLFLGYMGYHVNKSIKKKKKDAIVVPVEQDVDVGPPIGSPGVVLDAHVSWKVSRKPSREEREERPSFAPTAPPSNRHSLDSVVGTEQDRQNLSLVTNAEVLATLLENSPTFKTEDQERGRMISCLKLINDKHSFLSFHSLSMKYLNPSPLPVPLPNRSTK